MAPMPPRAATTPTATQYLILQARKVVAVHKASSRRRVRVKVEI